VYDFSKNVVPGQDEREKGYWRDVGTIDSFFHANMDLIAPVPIFNLYNEKWPVYTSAVRSRRRRCHAGAAASRRSSTAACCARGRSCPARTSNGRSSARAAFIDHDAHVTDSIIFPDVHIGAGVRLHRCIIDKNVVVPEWTRIGLELDADRERFTVSDDGIVVIEKGRTL
jgi:glucose-1-phosphate adenylyltransferase